MAVVRSLGASVLPEMYDAAAEACLEVTFPVSWAQVSGVLSFPALTSAKVYTSDEVNV